MIAFLSPGWGFVLYPLFPDKDMGLMGCKKGKSCEEIGQFVLETLEQEQISIQAVTALATIDLKKEEPGFLEFVKKYGLDFLTYPKEVLKEVPGTFSG